MEAGVGFGPRPDARPALVPAVARHNGRFSSGPIALVPLFR
jgi:hypothetical protein